MLKRAYLSVTRRKTKSIVMFLFLFVISTLALCSISIKNATNESMKLAKKSLGGEVTLSADMSKLREEFMGEGNKPPEQPGENNQTSEGTDIKEQMKDMRNKMNESNATIEDVNKIASIKYVSDVKYSFNVDATESSFELYSEEDESQDENTNMRMPGRRGMNNNLQVLAINTFNLDDDYKNKTIELVEGEAFDEEDSNVAIISYELATANDLSVGDEIKLKDSDEEEHTLKIIGIYQNSSGDNFNNNYNKIYVDIKAGESFLDDESYNDGNYKISSAVFYLNDPEEVDAFKEEANELVTDLEDRYLKLDIDTTAYDRMVSSIEGVKNFSNIILVVIVVASIVVISLMVINSLKDRNYELGVLLSLGEKKIKIIGQFILELVLIAVISFVLSIGCSALVSQNLADSVISMQIKAEEESSDFGGRGNGFTPGGMNGKGQMNKPGEINNSNVEVIDEIDVNVGVKDISIMAIIELGIIILSMLIPSIKILNSDPKDILSRRE